MFSSRNVVTLDRIQSVARIGQGHHLIYLTSNPTPSSPPQRRRTRRSLPWWPGWERRKALRLQLSSGKMHQVERVASNHTLTHLAAVHGAMGKANAKRIGEDERSPPCPTHGQSLATAVTAGKSGKGRKRARWAARKAARAARTSGASGDANGIADGEGEDGLLRYARSCEHTRSVHIDWVPIRETQIGIRRGQGQGEGGIVRLTLHTS